MGFLPDRLGRLQVHALASGSSGNCTLIQGGGTSIVLDAGLPLKNIAAALSKRGVSPDRLDAILLTHEHSDHVQGLGPLSRRGRTPVVANAATLSAAASRDGLTFETTELDTGCEIQIGSLSIRSFAVSHDAVAPVGYRISCGPASVFYATDVGFVSPELRTAIAGCQLAILEANHDLEWLRRGPYTPLMKERVASSTGHLSNAACAELLAWRAESGGPYCAWLAHLSRVNNSVALARRAVAARVAELTRTPVLLDVALRDHPSAFWQFGGAAVQLALL